MDRSKAAGSLAGIAAGLITMPFLGPLSAVVAMFSALAVANAFDKQSEKKKSKKISDTKVQLSDDTLDKLNRDYILPFLIRHNRVGNSQRTVNFMNAPNNVDRLFNYNVQSHAQNTRNLNSQVKPRSRKRRRNNRRSQIRINSFGEVFDPEDD